MKNIETANLNPNDSKKGQFSIMRALFIWGLIAVFYFYDNLLQVSPSAMKPELTLAFTKEAEQFGSLSAYCLYAYGLMQIPAGMLLDKFGPRRIITVACGLCAIGSFVFGLADSLWMAKLGRVLIGGGAAFALLCCLKVVSLWLPQSRYALMTGLTVTVGYLGGAFGLAFVVKIVEALGWRESMYLGGAVGVALCLLLWSFVSDKPNAKKSSAVETETKTVKSIEVSNAPATLNANTTNSNSTTNNGGNSGFLSVFKEIYATLSQNMKIIVKSKQTWIAALFAGLMFVPTLALGGLWGIPFLVEAHGIDREAAGFAASLMYVGWVVGGSFWGFVSDYLKRRNVPMIIGNIVTLAITLVIVYGNHLSYPVMKGLFFSLGFFSSSFIIAFAVVVENNPKRLAATASGFTNAINTMWGALAQPFIGLLLDWSASSNVVNGVAVAKEGAFSLAQYQSAFITLPASLVVSFIILMFLRETYCGTRTVEKVQSDEGLQATEMVV